jgi:recombination protein RecR
MNFSSKIIEEAVDQLSSFPGIGKKTALRMVVHLLKKEEDQVHALTQSISKLKSGLRSCSRCHNISEDELCSICSGVNREQQSVCVVRDFQDIIAIENTGQYNGTYHVLGGLISPIHGVTPSELTIDSLVHRVKSDQVKEIILALSATIEGDTTAFYISKQFQDDDIRISNIARGISVGGELEYADEITLGRSIINRLPFELVR